MKIVALGPVHPYRGGIATYHTLLIHRLLEKHLVQVVSFSRQYPGWLYPGQSDKDHSKKVPDFPVQYLLDSINPLSWYKTARWICQIKPDVVIIQWWVTFLAPAYSIIANYCKRKGIKVLYIIHNVYPHEGGRIHRPLASLALKPAHGYLTHTPEQQNVLLELIPDATVRTCPLPTWRSEGGFLAQEERITARQKFDLPTNARVALFFGIVRAYKGLLVLFEAVAMLKESGTPVYLLIAGEFWEKKEIYLSAMDRLGITDLVRLEDHYIPDEQVRQVFAAADVLVAPYTGGTQSGIVSLARGFGIPLVLTDRSAAGLDLTGFDLHTIARSGDASGLSQAILYGLENPSLSAAFPQDGWQEVVEAIEGLSE